MGRKPQSSDTPVIGPFQVSVALSLQDRVALLSLLPEQGNMLTMRTVYNLRMMLLPSDKEVQEWGIKQTQMGDKIGMEWDKAKAREVTFKLSVSAVAIITTELHKHDSDNTLQDMHVPVWDKFIHADEMVSQKAS